jgi:hypothetical protein
MAQLLLPLNGKYRFDANAILIFHVLQKSISQNFQIFQGSITIHHFRIVNYVGGNYVAPISQIHPFAMLLLSVVGNSNVRRWATSNGIMVVPSFIKICHSNKKIEIGGQTDKRASACIHIQTNSAVNSSNLFLRGSENPQSTY